jgi:tRNA U34 5-methylaminomethyl-2-thiouridine-forming methyltransferase MnmC
LGYNTFLTIIENEKLANPKKIEFYSPELDLALINSLAKFEYPKEFDKIEHIIQAISKDLYYEDEYYKIEIFCGDARKFIKTLKEIDIVYQDPFSSDVNSELWNLEYFYNLYQATSSNPIITTYSIATNVRLSMSENGFLIYEIRNLDTRKSTLAFKKPQNRYKYIDMQLKKQNNPLAKAID